MPQLFPRSANQIAKATIVLAIVGAASAGALLYTLDRSPYHTGENLHVSQEVPFSHDHHTEGLGIDCRYCHTTVEESKFAGIPPTATCMNCHKVVWADTEMLKPVRDSWASGEALRWNRVNDLPDYVYFNHSVHVKKGVGCETCHGPVNEMPLMRQEHSLQMRWCLECHNAPEKFLRPREQVFNLNWEPSDEGMSQAELGEKLVEEYQVESLIHCYVCHR